MTKTNINKTMKHCETCTCGEKYKNGVDWHILGIQCRCGQDVCPIADEAGEDIRLFEKMAEYRGKKCGVCNCYYKLSVEDGNMASKRREMQKVASNQKA